MIRNLLWTLHTKSEVLQSMAAMLLLYLAAWHLHVQSSAKCMPVTMMQLKMLQNIVQLHDILQAIALGRTMHTRLEKRYATVWTHGLFCRCHSFSVDNSSVQQCRQLPTLLATGKT